MSCHLLEPSLQCCHEPIILLHFHLSNIIQHIVAWCQYKGSIYTLHVTITCTTCLNWTRFDCRLRFWNTCHYHKPIYPCLHFKMSFMYNYNVNDYKNNVVYFHWLHVFTSEKIQLWYQCVAGWQSDLKVSAVLSHTCNEWFMYFSIKILWLQMTSIPKHVFVWQYKLLIDNKMYQMLHHVSNAALCLWHQMLPIDNKTYQMLHLLM